MAITSLFDDEQMAVALRLRVRTLAEAGLSEAEIRARLFEDEPRAPAGAETPGPAGEPKPLPFPSLDDDDARTAAIAASPPPGPNLRAEVERLFGALKPPLNEGPGLTLEFIAATSGEGTSSIAREFAVVAARHTDRPVLLLDLNRDRSNHVEVLAGTHPELGHAGPALDLGMPAEAMLYRQLGGSRDRSGAGGALTLHRFGHSSLLVSRLNVPPAVPIDLVPGNRFWTELRARVALTVVDGPSIDRSGEGLAVASAMDAVVMVVQAEKNRLPVLENLRDQLLAQSATIAGIVFNKRRFYIPAVVYRLL